MTRSTSAPPTGTDWPSPVEAGQRWAEIATKSQAALDTFMRKQASDQPQVFDMRSVSEPLSHLFTSMMSNPTALMEAQFRMWQSYAELWRATTMRAFGMAAEPVAAPKKTDRRFKHEKWESDITFDFIKQSYLIASETLQQMVAKGADDGLPEPARAKLRFYIGQVVDAMSPTNFAATNPEVVEKTMRTGGDNLLKGFSNLLDDLSADTGLIKRRAPDTYKVGENIAITPGSVVFRNDLMELIQYAPTTETVHDVPILLVPPWVNKFYLFDLQPKNSFVKWIVDQGFTVFAISWVNPDSRHAEKDFEDYLLEGPLAAFDVMREVTGQDKVNPVGYCLGGTLTATALAYMAEKGEADRLASATLIATLLDYERLGEFEVFIDKDQVGALSAQMDTTGYLDSRDLGRLFSVVRANDLVWSLVVGNYLLAEEAVPFDMLTWFADGARMPAKMVKTFLNRVALENALSRPGGLHMAGTPIDLSKVQTPTTVVALRDDHVAAWDSTYKNVKLLGGSPQFILGGSGHNAGVINPPAQGKFGYWTRSDLPATGQEWLNGATQNQGSWWPHWIAWISSLSGEQVPARAPGSAAHPALEPAPGSYVRTLS